MNIVRNIPVDVSTSEIHDLILSDRRINMRELVKATGVSYGHFNFAWKIVGEKSFGEMGAAFTLRIE